MNKTFFADLNHYTVYDEHTKKGLDSLYQMVMQGEVWFPDRARPWAFAGTEDAASGSAPEDGASPVESWRRER